VERVEGPKRKHEKKLERKKNGVKHVVNDWECEQKRLIPGTREKGNCQNYLYTNLKTNKVH